MRKEQSRRIAHRDRMRLRRALTPLPGLIGPYTTSPLPTSNASTVSTTLDSFPLPGLSGPSNPSPLDQPAPSPSVDNQDLNLPSRRSLRNIRRPGRYLDPPLSPPRRRRRLLSPPPAHNSPLLANQSSSPPDLLPPVDPTISSFIRAECTPYFDIGQPDQLCELCGALFFDMEKNTMNAYTRCCQKGKVTLPPIPRPSPLIETLLTSQHPKSDHFRKNAIYYNNCLAMASVGA